MIPPMDRQEWERDVSNSQRNIVFPDTVQNEARFYRNLLSGKIWFSGTERTAILVFAIAVCVVGCLLLIDPISFLFHPHSKIRDSDIFLTIFGAGGLLIGIGLAQLAVSSNSGAARERSKRSHHHSSNRS